MQEDVICFFCGICSFFLSFLPLIKAREQQGRLLEICGATLNYPPKSMTDLWTIVLLLSVRRIESRPGFINCAERHKLQSVPCRLTQYISLQVQLNWKPKLKTEKLRLPPVHIACIWLYIYVYTYIVFLPVGRAAESAENRQIGECLQAARKGVGKVSGVMSNKSSSENERKGVEEGGESSDAVRLRDGGTEEKTAGWAAGSRY